MSAGLDTAHRPARIVPPHLLLRAAQGATRAWRTAAGLIHTVTVLSWRALCLGLLGMTALQAGFMLLGGDAWYSSPSYRLFELVPGGMRTWGLALAALWGSNLFAYGQARRGDGQALRHALALLAGWFMLWLLIMVGTWVLDWRIYSASAVPVLLFFTWLSVLVGRATPPDRG